MGVFFMKPIDISKLHEALLLLNEQLILLDAPETEIVVCGGSALIATGLVPRTTQDVYIKDMFKQLGWHYVSDQI